VVGNALKLFSLIAEVYEILFLWKDI